MVSKIEPLQPTVGGGITIIIRGGMIIRGGERFNPVVEVARLQLTIRMMIAGGVSAVKEEAVLTQSTFLHRQEAFPPRLVHQPAVKTRRVHRRRKTHGGQYGRTRPVIQGTTVTLQIYVLTMLKETRVQTMARAIAEAREQAGQQEENSLWRECYSLIHDDSSLHKLDR